MRWAEEERARYSIVGGVAVVRHGYQRTTKDIDLLVAQSSLDGLGARLLREGFALTASDEVNFRVFRRKNPRGRVDLLAANNAFKRRILDRSTLVEVAGRNVPFAAVEDVVALKLLAAASDPERREDKDLDDVRELLKRSRGEDRIRVESVIRFFRREDLL